MEVTFIDADEQVRGNENAAAAQPVSKKSPILSNEEMGEEISSNIGQVQKNHIRDMQEDQNSNRSSLMESGSFVNDGKELDITDIV